MAIASASAASADFGTACADHGLLDLVGRVLGNQYAEHRGRQHGDAAGLAEFQRGDAVLVDKGLFDRSLRRPEIAEHGGEPLMDRQQAAGQRQVARRLYRTAADEDEPVALGLDHAPTSAAQAGVDADDPDGLANRWGCHGVVITPEPGERNIKRTEIPCPGSSVVDRPSHVIPAKAGIQYAEASRIKRTFWNTG